MVDAVGDAHHQRRADPHGEDAGDAQRHHQGREAALQDERGADHQQHQHHAAHGEHGPVLGTGYQQEIDRGECQPGQHGETARCA
jgi:hypothetical protein